MKWTFNITKTFEPNQKSERGSLDLLVIHPNFWGELPLEYTKRIYVAGILRSGSAVKIQVPGYTEFFIKPIEYGDDRNGNHLLCGIIANTRQGIGVAGAYLVNPDEIESGNLVLLRNHDRYPIRKFVVHYPEPQKVEILPEKKKSILNTEIKSLAVLDKDINSFSILNKEIPGLAVLDTEIPSLSVLDTKIF